MRYLYSTFLRSKHHEVLQNGMLTGSHSFYTCNPHDHPDFTALDGTARTRRHTSAIAYYSVYRPRKDERLSWPSWLTCSGWFTHISSHPWDRSKANVLTTVQRNQPTIVHIVYQRSSDIVNESNLRGSMLNK